MLCFDILPALNFKLESKYKYVINIFTFTTNLVLKRMAATCGMKKIAFTNSKQQMAVSVSLRYRLSETYLHSQLVVRGWVENRFFKSNFK